MLSGFMFEYVDGLVNVVGEVKGGGRKVTVVEVLRGLLARKGSLQECPEMQ